MDIEVGDILVDRSNCLWNIIYTNGDLIKIQLGESNFTYEVSKNNLLHNVHVTKKWAIKKKVTVLNKEALEDL